MDADTFYRRAQQAQAFEKLYTNVSGHLQVQILEPLNDWNPIRRFIVALTLSPPRAVQNGRVSEGPQGLVITCCTPGEAEWLTRLLILI